MKNPYAPSLKMLFYGREEIVRNLIQNEESGQSVVLIGGRRCGKTSLMERLLGYFQQAATPGSNLSEAWKKTVPDSKNLGPNRNLRPHWPVIIDFQGVRFESFEKVLAHMAKAIVDSNPPVKNLPPVPTENLLDTTMMETWLKEVDARLGESNLGGLALLLDEIDSLFDKTWHHDLMAFIRRMDDFMLKSRVWFVLAGSDSLDNYKNKFDGSPALNTTRRMFLTDLDYGARKRMAVEPFANAGRLPLADNVLKEVDRLAGGNVWLLTLILEYLFRHDNSLNRIMFEMVGEAGRNLLDEQGDTFARKYLFFP